MILLVPVVLFHHVWRSIIRVIYQDETLGYALAVPFVVAFLFWQRRHRLNGLRPRHRWAGVTLTAAGCVLYLLAEHNVWGWGNDVAWQAGPLIAVVGVAVTLWGVGLLRAAGPAFAAAFLILPPPYWLVSRVGAHLMYIAATVTADVLLLLGFAVEQYNNLLVVNGHDLNVAEACSGLRSFFSLFVVVTLLAFALPLRGWVRAAMIISTPAMAILGNMVRLIPIAALYAADYTETADIAHNLLGLFTFAAIVFAYSLSLSLLRWAGVSLVAPPAAGDPHPPAATDVSPPPPHPYRIFRPATVLTLGVLLATLPAVSPAWSTRAQQAFHAHVARLIGESPLTLPGHTATPTELPYDAIDALQPNAYRMAQLTPDAGGPPLIASLIQCRRARDMHGHHPKSCYPGSGWHLIGTRAVAVQIGEHAVDLPEYYFQRSDARGTRGIYVVSLFIVPHRPFSGDPSASLASRHSHSARNAWGVAQFSLLFPATLDTRERDATLNQLLASNRDVLNALRLGAPP